MTTVDDENPISFLAGWPDFQNTRLYSQWRQNSTINVIGREYANVDSIVTYQYSPWRSAVPLDGTDGIQFSPALDKDSIISAFVNDFSRNIYFECLGKDKSTYKHFWIYTFGVQKEMFENKEKNPDNENYDIYISGTTNLTSTLGANSFVSKGYYYGL